MRFTFTYMGQQYTAAIYTIATGSYLIEVLPLALHHLPILPYLRQLQAKNPETTVIPPMQWENVTFARSEVDDAVSAGRNSVVAWLIPDGGQVQKRVWIKVALHEGVRRAQTIDDVDLDMWFDAARGFASPTVDMTGRTIRIDRFPADAPSNLQHSYTFVFTGQNTTGPNVHPVNLAIQKWAPDAERPWRGNVLVFRHGSTPKKVFVNVEDQHWIAVTWVIAA
ncbi:hypothetical protein B0H15DRAFT_956864 [Mycena belliarum]|uniref:Uncharacterized protein n=1 Tax=Mycena belliarum TaxID=1033014 RepID=A0AAD6TNH9_9AGAR|nr:hypothetical protein B0H15DRAFT_956864 [Mycena belliae]